jgi:HEAT repeat protein
MKMSLFKPNVEKMEKNKDVEGLMKALKHKDTNVRERAAEALGKLGDARAVEPLIQALKKDEDRARALGIDNLLIKEIYAEALKKIRQRKVKDPRVTGLTAGSNRSSA